MRIIESNLLDAVWYVTWVFAAGNGAGEAPQDSATMTIADGSLYLDSSTGKLYCYSETSKSWGEM